MCTGTSANFLFDFVAWHKTTTRIYVVESILTGLGDPPFPHNLKIHGSRPLQFYHFRSCRLKKKPDILFPATPDIRPNIRYPVSGFQKNRRKESYLPSFLFLLVSLSQSSTVDMGGGILPAQLLVPLGKLYTELYSRCGRWNPTCPASCSSWWTLYRALQ